MANIKDVAAKAGVGIATVSRVINNSGYVKKETRAKVEKVIEEIEYIPNEIARSMTLQKNNIVAFILPNSTHLFFGELLYFVEAELFEHGYKLMICNSSEQLYKEVVYLEMLKNNRVDAVILLTNNDVDAYIDKSKPVVSFDRRFEGVPIVASDNYGGGVMAAKKLIDLGCEKYMFIGDDAQGDSSSVITEVTKRRTGFNDHLKSVGITDVTNIEYPLGDYIVSDEYIHGLLEKHPDIDGIFAISDAAAAAVIKELQHKGKRVPEDVKVIGFDGGRSFLNLGKKITSIGQSPDLIAKEICYTIMNFYNNEAVKDRIIPVYFEEGDTT